jgi:Methyltransferase domain
MMQAMSKFDDAVRGLYFRKSKQARLEQAIARIEAAQQNSEQAIAHVETELARIKPHVPVTVEEALDTAISSSATTLNSHDQNAEVYRRWYQGMDFTDDWTSDNLSIWSQVFDAHGKSFTEGLEIGSYEGRSAIFFLEYLPKLHLTCVDLFEYTSEFFAKRKPWVQFDKNLSKYAGRYEKIVSFSANALAEFASKGRKFDLIYIDGSHTRDDVFIDALLSWKLLNVNGVLIFDDYFWGWHFKPSERPKEAIEYFVYSHLDGLKILHKGVQFIVKKVT